VAATESMAKTKSDLIRAHAQGLRLVRSALTQDQSMELNWQQRDSWE